MANGFELQFPRAEIPALAERYMKTQGNKDAAAFNAGARIRARKGHHTEDTLKDLDTIMRWKSHLGLHHFTSNTPEEIFEALDFAMDTEQERTAMGILCGLDGVAAPMASAILTALQEPDDERFTIIDFRALQALGTKMDNPSVGYYLDYLDELWKLKEATGHSLRTIDRANWQWSVEQSKVAA